MRRLDAAIAESEPSGDPAPAAAIERHEATSDILRHLATLPDKQQEAVHLKFHAGLSYQQIADVLDTSVSNVGVLLHTAIKTLREALAGESS